MFTGIVSAIGEVVEATPGRLGVEHAATARRLRRGSSVAVNGACLTVVNKRGARFYMDVVPETLRRTNLGKLVKGSRVNLELAMSPAGLLDGHIVQGHVDATAEVRKAGTELQLGLPATLRRFVVEKGSIAVDGVSLTVAGVGRDSFTVALIPHTRKATIAGAYRKGDTVNLEADVIARYVARNLRR